MTLSHDVSSSGAAVLLLHSTIADRRMWRPQIPALTGAGLRVVAVDLPGYGSSPVPATEFDEAAMVLDVLDSHGIGPAAVVGASGGGQVALEIAARWPSRVTALALLCTALRGFPASRQRREFAEREDALLAEGDVDAATELNVATFLGPEADDQTRAFVRVMQRHTFDVQLAAPAGAEQADVPWSVDAITARSLLVSGVHDLPDFADIATDLASRLPAARHVHLDWAGHLPSLERPAELNRLLVDFLGQ